MIIALSLIIVVALIAVVWIYMQQPKFGKKPSGERLSRMQSSPHYQKGRFRNKTLTPTLAEGHTIAGEIYKQLFKKYPGRIPLDSIPSVKTDLLNLPPGKDILVWFGHSSYFMQIAGRKILVDPVFSGNASPIPRSIRAYKGSDIYTVADIPEIDYLLITHDHYDHLDYETIVGLTRKIKKVICGLGVGAHFERWGYASEIIIEKDWHEQVISDNGLIIYTEPARHKSGRGFSPDNTLWLSYVIKTPATAIYLGGDSGYDTHFAEIGKTYGPFDLVILDNGQYNSAWRYIHALPDEVLKAAQDLKAKRLLPVHSSKFALSRHAWDEPLAKISELNKVFNIPLVTPMIGEQVNLGDDKQPFQQWWTSIK